MRIFLVLFFLLIIAACAPLPGKEVACPADAKLCPDGSAVGRVGPNCEFAECPEAEVSKDACQQDADCICGGIDTRTDNCFVGNKGYAEEHVDFSRDCPDFCTGIAGHLETKCVSGTCQNVVREGGLPEPVACTEEAKVCPDGSAVGRVPPDCAFAPCPEEPTADLSSAHWLCEDGSWKGAPEECFENKCLSKNDCQLIGVKGICGPYKIAAPTSMHKPPVFYEFRCGQEPCSEIVVRCADPATLAPFYKGVECQEEMCVLRE